LELNLTTLVRRWWEREREKGGRKRGRREYQESVRVVSSKFPSPDMPSL
jgi:hypothetical protein